MAKHVSHYEKASSIHRQIPESEADIDDRADHLMTSLQIGTTDCQNLMRHVLDCLGSLRVRAKMDHRMTPAIRQVFKDACVVFLDAVIEGEDQAHEDGSAIHLLMNVFPDERKKRDGRGWLPLHWAASIDHIGEEHLKSIAKERPLNAKCTHGAALNASLTLEQQAGEGRVPAPGLLPFHFACSMKHPRLSNIKTLLSVYPEAVKLPEETKQWLPLHFAAFNCMSQDVVRFLLDIHQPAVFSQTRRGQLPFLLSMHNMRSEVLDELLQPNPDALDSCDRHGNTALHYASHYCNPDGAKKALAWNPEIAVLKNFKDELPIHKAFVHVRKDNQQKRWRQLELLRIILDENPETVSQVDKEGNLPLHLAVGFNASYEVCEAVYNVYPTAALLPDSDGNLPVHYCDPSNDELYKMLFRSSKPLQRLGLSSSFAQFTNFAEQAQPLKGSVKEGRK